MKKQKITYPAAWEQYKLKLSSYHEDLQEEKMEKFNCLDCAMKWAERELFEFPMLGRARLFRLRIFETAQHWELVYAFDDFVV